MRTRFRGADYEGIRGCGGQVASEETAGKSCPRGEWGIITRSGQPVSVWQGGCGVQSAGLNELDRAAAGQIIRARRDNRIRTCDYALPYPLSQCDYLLPCPLSRCRLVAALSFVHKALSCLFTRCLGLVYRLFRGSLGRLGTHVRAVSPLRIRSAGTFRHRLGCPLYT